MTHNITVEIMASRSQRSDGADTFHMVVNNRNNSTRLMEITLPLEAFVDMITNRCAYGTADVYQAGIDRLGKVRQVKSEFVPAKGARYEADWEETRQSALAPFEVEGWRARRDDYGNYHRHARQDDVEGYTVSFERYIDPPAA